jgi:hypothetical protein
MDMLPNEILYMIFSQIPQGQHIFRDIKLNKRLLMKNIKSIIRKRDITTLTWLIENNKNSTRRSQY